MRPILFSLGSLNFYSYGFFTALGIILAGMLVDYLARKKKLLTSRHREYFLIDALLFSLIAGIIGARLTYIIIYNLIFRLESAVSFNLLTGGFVFYGGLAAGLIAFIWWMRRQDKPILGWLDMVIVGISFGLAASEIGGYLNDGQIAHIGGFLGTSIITGMGYNYVITEKKATGRTFFYGLFLIFLLYFFLGFWSPEKVEWLGLTLGQWGSLIGLLSIAGVLAYPLPFQKSKPTKAA